LKARQDRNAGERLVRSLLWVQGHLETFTGRTGNFLTGLSLGLLDHSALGRLTIAAYDRRGTYEAQTIADWEARWFKRDLPPPPARILIGAAGSGREVQHLERYGYEVTAFEPAAQYVRNANASGLLRHPMLLGRYEDLLDDTSTLSAGLAALAPFDAVLLGWGSLSHVPGAEARITIMTQFRRLAPDGPLLISFQLPASANAPSLPRAREAGVKVARLFGGGGQADPLDGMSGRAGYHHWFTEPELVALATEISCFLKTGATTIDTAGFPHATLWPEQ
jgi:hypothetical protein